MKLFGEYLVDKNLISNEVLAEALMEQIRTMPPSIEIAWKSKIIDSNQLLAILKLQTKKKIGFIEAMKELSLWKPEIEQTLFSNIDSVRIPLGKILVQKKYLTMEALTSSLDEYLGEHAQPKKSDTIPKAFLETYSLELRDQILAICEECRSGKELMKNKVDYIFENVHRVRGACRLDGTDRIEKICESFENCLKLFSPLPSCPPDLSNNLGRTTKAWAELFWSFREGLEQGKSENQLLEDGDLIKKAEELSGLIEVLKFDVEMTALS